MMKINPGGTLALQDIVGRDALVDQIGDTLETQSVVLVAERRMGKTHVLEKLKAQPRHPDWVMLKRDVEGLRTAKEFVHWVMADLHPLLSTLKKFREWLAHIAQDAGGLQVGTVKLPDFPAPHWKQVLLDTTSHLASLEPRRTVVFLWDELPMLVQNIAKTSPQEAMELLDILRSIRQENPWLRMVFTGSIGLHHVVRQLKGQGYINAPVNDMAVVEVPPLSPADATHLAQRLFEDNRIGMADASVPETVAREVDGIPYYIHHVLRALAKEHAGTSYAVSAAEVHAMVDRAIQSAHDPWHLKHYEERTREYYGADRVACHALLDGIAAFDGPIAMREAINRASGTVPALDAQQWLELVQLLERDYYLSRDPATGRLRFKFDIVRRWWCWSRGLVSPGGNGP